MSCLNPFWREETETREDIATWIGGFEFPVPDGLELYDGWEIGYRQPSLIVNVYNSGDVKMCIRDSSCALAVAMPIARANMMITFLITLDFSGHERVLVLL